MSVCLESLQFIKFVLHQTQFYYYYYYYYYCLDIGSTDGKIHCWKTETGTKVVVLNGEHTGPVQSVQFNPKYMMLASACTNMVCILCLNPTTLC